VDQEALKHLNSNLEDLFAMMLEVYVSTCLEH